MDGRHFWVAKGSKDQKVCCESRRGRFLQGHVPNARSDRFHPICARFVKSQHGPSVGSKFDPGLLDGSLVSR